MRRGYLRVAMSGAILIVGAVSPGVRGLNLGIDFRGGTQISFTTPTPQPIGDVRGQMKAIGHADAIVQGRGTAFGSDKQSFKSFQIRAKHLKVNQQINEVSQLDSKLGRSVDANS